MEKTITIVQKIPRARIAELLCSALEGGSNYWYHITKKIEPKVWSWEKLPTFATKEEAAKYNKHFVHYYPFNAGGALFIDDSNADEPELKEPVMLNWNRIVRGLERWAEDALAYADEKVGKYEHTGAHPSHWAALIADDCDGNTADVFLQYCVFGKVIYG